MTIGIHSSVDGDVSAVVVSDDVYCATRCPEVCGQWTDKINRRRNDTCCTHSPGLRTLSCGKDDPMRLTLCLEIENDGLHKSTTSNLAIVFNTRDKIKLLSQQECLSRETLSSHTPTSSPYGIRRSICVRRTTYCLLHTPHGLGKPGCQHIALVLSLVTDMKTSFSEVANKWRTLLIERYCGWCCRVVIVMSS